MNLNKKKKEKKAGKNLKRSAFFSFPSSIFIGKHNEHAKPVSPLHNIYMLFSYNHCPASFWEESCGFFPYLSHFHPHLLKLLYIGICLKIFELFGVCSFELPSLLQLLDWKCLKDMSAWMKSFLSPPQIIQNLFKCKCIFFMSNHCLRPGKRLKKCVMCHLILKNFYFSFYTGNHN